MRNLLDSVVLWNKVVFHFYHILQILFLHNGYVITQNSNIKVENFLRRIKLLKKQSNSNWNDIKINFLWLHYQFPPTQDSISFSQKVHDNFMRIIKVCQYLLFECLNLKFRAFWYSFKKKFYVLIHTFTAVQLLKCFPHLNNPSGISLK